MTFYSLSERVLDLGFVCLFVLISFILIEGERVERGFFGNVHINSKCTGYDHTSFLRADFPKAFRSIVSAVRVAQTLFALVIFFFFFFLIFFNSKELVLP